MSIPFDITFHPSWYHKHCGVSFARPFFEDAQTRVEADVQMRRVLFEKFGVYGVGEENPQPRPVLGSDLLAAGYLHSAILGCDIVYSEADSPVVVCKNITEDEAAALAVPDLESHPLWQNTEEQIAFLQQRFGHVLPCVNLMGAQNIAIDLRGTDLFFDYLDEPDIAHHLLDVCTRLCVRIGQRFAALSPQLSGGVTAIINKTKPQTYVTSDCTVELVSRETYEEFLMQCDIAMARAFPAFGIHHCGQTMEHVVAGYAKVPNLSFAEVGAGSGLAAVRKALPGVFLNARYSPARLKTVGQQALRDELSQLYSQGAPESLLSVSCVGIDAEVSDEQVLCFLDAAARLG